MSIFKKIILRNLKTYPINCLAYMLIVSECHLAHCRLKEILFVRDFPLNPERANEKACRFHRGELASNCCLKEALCK